MEDARVYVGSSVCFGRFVDSKIVEIFISVSIIFDYDGAAATTANVDFQFARNECGEIIDHFTNSIKMFILFNFYSLILFLQFFFFHVSTTVQLDGSNPKVDPNDEPDFYEQATIPA